MATRKIYKDSKGTYFKGEGMRFRHKALENAQPNEHVTNVSVSCGQAGAGCEFWYKGHRYFTTSTFDSESQR